MLRPDPLASRVLVLGAGGMLGHMLYHYLAYRGDIEVLGTVRSTVFETPPQSRNARVVKGVSVDDIGLIVDVLDNFQPDFVINCIAAGLHANSEEAFRINSLFPHQLAALVTRSGARLLHFSTDGVFSGIKGNYSETDSPDADDIYGRSKLIGEVGGYKCLTLRTSIIGPEIGHGKSLVSWLSRQEGVVRGFPNVIFSGFTTFELSRIICEYILPRPELNGIFHLSAAAISKFELLTLIANIYNMPVDIVPDGGPVLDRSLNSTKLRSLIGYAPPDWSTLIRQMRGCV